MYACLYYLYPTWWIDTSVSLRSLPNFARLTCWYCHASIRVKPFICPCVSVCVRANGAKFEFNCAGKVSYPFGCHGNEMPLTYTMNSGVRRTNGLCAEYSNLHSGKNRQPERRVKALWFRDMWLVFVLSCLVFWRLGWSRWWCVGFERVSGIVGVFVFMPR